MKPAIVQRSAMTAEALSQPPVVSNTVYSKRDGKKVNGYPS